jgi:hypothetical protein
MARGVDGIAQKAALDAGGRSFAVLGCGVDLCYPDENQALYDRLLEAGGILSEFPPGTPPDSKNFPQRNRIISGLADLVLVIEARKRSGTQITVDMALEQGREVFALPGRVSDALSDGCNRLIRQGAWIATCPEDVLEYFYGTGYGEGDEIIKKTGQGEEKPAGMAGDMAVKRGSMTASMEAAAGDPYHAQKNELEKNDSGIDAKSLSAVIRNFPKQEKKILPRQDPTAALFCLGSVRSLCPSCRSHGIGLKISWC